MAFLKLHGIVQYRLLYDLDSLVLVYAILSLLNILTLPIDNAFSRRLERSADRFGLDMTNDRAAFIRTMKKLADQNLADSAPGRFYEITLYNHPPISRRIAFAESYNRKN
jgi:STE24 endopeptidase